MSAADTPSGESGDLTVDGAATLFADMIEPPPPKEEPIKVDTEIDPPKKKEEPAEPEAEPEAEPNAQEEGDDAPITITVDGKQVTLTKAELADAYKNGLRQTDYTKKTMEAADTRKAAEAEVQKAQQERATYAQNLTRMQAQLEGVLQEQAKIDWDKLLEADPVEFLKQKHLFDQRQAALQTNQQQQQRVQQQIQSEATQAKQARLATEQQELLAKLPAWKDSAKATVEQKAIREFLKEQGYADAELDIHDHRAVLLSRKAMLYDQMMSKAAAAAKKVEHLPTKVERPGVSREANPLDGRNKAMQRHAKSGTLESAADVFTSLLS